MRRRLALSATLLAASFLSACGTWSRPEAIDPAKSPEQIVFVRSQDDVVSGGMLFSPPRDSAKPLAIIWMVARQQGETVAVTTALIDGGDHMYTGRESEVAQIIARWAAGLAASH